MPTNTTKRTTDLAQADALLQKALPQVELEIFDESTVNALQEAMELYEKWEMKEQTAEAYEYWGRYSNSVVGFQQSILYHQKALNIRLELYGEMHEATARSYTQLAAIYINLHDFKQSKVMINKSLKINIKLFGERHISIARCYMVLGSYSFFQQNYHAAIDYFFKAVEIIENENEPKGILLGEIYNNMANSYASLNDLVQKMDFLEKSKEILQQTLPPNHYRFALNYISFGNIYLGIGELDKAIIFFQRGMEISENTGTNPLQIIYGYTQLAGVYTKKGNYPKVIECGQRALALLEQNNIVHIAGIYCYMHITSASFSLEDMPQAIAHIEKADNLLYELYDSKNVPIKADIKMLMGRYWERNQELDKGIEYYKEALKIHKENKNSTIERIARIQTYIGHIFFQKKKYLSALHYFHEALSNLFKVPPTEDIYNHSFLHRQHDVVQREYTGALSLIISKAEAFFSYYSEDTQSLRDLEMALQTYEIAFAFGDSVKQSFQSDDFKLLIIKEIHKGVYSLTRALITYFEAKQEVAYLHKAFEFSEKNKAYLMLQNGQEKIAKKYGNLPDGLLEKESNLKIRLILLQKSIQHQEQLGKAADKELLRKYRNENFQAFHQFEALQKQLEAAYPEYYRLKYSTFTVSVVELQGLLEEGQSVLNYVVGKYEIYLLLVTPNEYEVFVQQKPKNWKEMVQEYLQSIKFSQKEQFVQHSFALYQLLLQEAMPYIIPLFEETSPQTFILPDGELHYLPFETLLIQEANLQTAYEEMDYFLHHCQVSYHYSATLLYFDLQKQAQVQQAPTDITFTGFAPVYETTSNGEKQALAELQAEYTTAVNRSEALRSDGTWMYLPHSKTEVENIAQLFVQYGHKSETFLFESANKQNLIEQFSKNRFILIAAHGIVNQEYPQLSGLVLANEASNIIVSTDHSTITEETERMGGTAIVDCLLNMKEVAMNSMNADLVVLSSCESGIGELHKGEGMMAVNRGFLESGAKNVISTLFKVNDRASSELTQLLFKHILEGDSFTIALQKAKLELLKREGMSPKMWSGFVLFGVGNS